MQGHSSNRDGNKMMMRACLLQMRLTELHCSDPSSLLPNSGWRWGRRCNLALLVMDSSAERKVLSRAGEWPVPLDTLVNKESMSWFILQLFMTLVNGQSLESNPQLSFATRMEDWTSMGQHKRHPEFPVVTRESRRNSRKPTWFPRHRKMKPFPEKGRKEGGKEVRKERWARVSPHRLWAMFCFLSGNRKESVSTANTEYQTHNITLITTTAKTKMNTSLPPRYHVSDIWPRESLAQEQNEPLQLKLAGTGGEGRGKVWFKGYHTGLKDKDFWALICCIMLRTSLFQFLFYYFQNNTSPCPLPHGGAFQESIQTHTQSL